MIPRRVAIPVEEPKKLEPKPDGASEQTILNATLDQETVAQNGSRCITVSVFWVSTAGQPAPAASPVAGRRALASFLSSAIIHMGAQRAS
jgi:hypothetical protein